MLIGMKRVLLLVLPLVVLALAGCYTVPETGRSAFVLPLGDEVAQGAAAFADLKTKQPISHDAAANAQVQRVGQRIAQAVGRDLPTAQWEFVVFESKDVNAFALPGGKVGVYTGLLKLVKSDDELAAVMGHEIAHVTARHGAQRMSQAAVAALGGVILSGATSDSSRKDLYQLGYLGLAGGALLKFSRDNESEADYIDIRYAAKAGYDPHAAITFWRKMAAEKPETGGVVGAVMNLASTHPTNAQRIADLERAVPSVLPLYQAAKLRYE